MSGGLFGLEDPEVMDDGLAADGLFADEGFLPDVGRGDAGGLTGAVTPGLPPLVGHGEVVAQIGAFLDSGRFPHAILLHGPRGIGKRTLAERVAHVLICGRDGSEGLEYLRGPLASQLAAGSCADYHLLDIPPKRKSIGVDAVRDVLDVLSRSADTARVVVVDAVDDLTGEAANTLLKTLEEPRAGIYFLLVCHRLSSVLPTIRSRTRLVRMSPLDDGKTLEVLQRHGVGSDAEALVALASGCPGKVMGDEADQWLATLQKVRAWVEDVCAGRKSLRPSFSGNGGLVAEALVQAVGERVDSLAGTMLYRGFLTLMAEAETFNLPPGYLAEVMMLRIEDTWRLGEAA